MTVRQRVVAALPPVVRERVRLGLWRTARARGWKEPRRTRLLLDLQAALVSGGDVPRFAALVRPESPDWAGLVRAAHPRAHVVVLRPDEDPATVHALLAAHGRLHAVLDDTGGGHERLEALQDVFLHLRPGGALIVRRPPGEPATAWDGLRTAVREGVEQREGLRWRAVPGAVRSVVMRRTHVVLVNDRRAVAKLREHELDVVLAERAGAGMEELVRLPALEFESRCHLVENSPTRSADMPPHYRVPAMSLRRYDDVLCLPRQVAVRGNLALPDTFRFNAAPELHNRYLRDLGPRFAPAPARPGRARDLPGTYFYLDSEWTRHFGHATTEQLSRMWAVPHAREVDPGVKLLLDRRNGRTGLTSYERTIFGAAGFEEVDIVLHHRPVRVERLLAASPMWALPTHVHPDIVDLWHAVGRRIAAQADTPGHGPRVFVSRRVARRGCRNLPEVEDLFRSYGFEVLYPEDLPLPAQVALFREAEVIAGFAGSGMFNVQYCETPREVIVLGPTSYPSRNEYLICAAAGHRLTYVWSQPDPEEVRGPQPQYAGFTFDMQSEGVFLRGVLDGL